MYYLVSIYLENIDVFCVRPIRNSNLPKRLYPDVRNGKANTRPDSCYRNEYNRTEKSTGMPSFPEHSVPLNFTA